MTVAYRVSRLSQQRAQHSRRRDAFTGRACPLARPVSPSIAGILRFHRRQGFGKATFVPGMSRLSLAYGREGSSLLLFFLIRPFPPLPCAQGTSGTRGSRVREGIPWADLAIMTGPGRDRRRPTIWLQNCIQGNCVCA